MLLDALKNFEWMNEPQEMSFADIGVKIRAEEKTDFWQDFRHNLHQDSGHFFYREAAGDFELTVKWSFIDISGFCQCGLMGRIDENNWFKISVLAEDTNRCQLAGVVTAFGISDMALQPINSENGEIWYRLRSEKGIFSLAYSVDGKDYNEVRLFQPLKDCSALKVGAYICNPSERKFSALLSAMDFRQL